MPSTGHNRSRQPLRWRLAILSVAAFAIALAALGAGLAQQQTAALWRRLMEQAERHARIIRNSTEKQFHLELRDLTARMRRVAVSRRTRSEPTSPWPPTLPVWVDGLFLWDGTGLRVLIPPTDAPEGSIPLIEGQLADLAPDRPGERDSDLCELLLGPTDGVPLAIAYLRAFDALDQPVIYAARIDPIRLKANLLEPHLAVDDGLEIVPATQASGRSLRMAGALRFWAVQPTAAFVHEQRNTVVVQTLTYFGLTLLALVTVLVAMWFLVRVARRNVALAELKSNFVADVSHEFKTPLALIRLFGETLQSGRVASEAKRQEYYAIITRESTRLTNLVDNVLDFARIEAGRKEYTLEPTDVGKVVKETYEAYRPELDHAGFAHDLKIAADLPPVDANPDAISQVLVNLMSNAVKYSGQERHLVIELTHDVRRDQRGVLIAVHDRGIGIKPEDRAHLFDGFFRAADDRVRDKGGTGLGLALVKHIVDAHHGSVEVESRLVNGSTFRVFLPASGRAEGEMESRPVGSPRGLRAD